MVGGPFLLGGFAAVLVHGCKRRMQLCAAHAQSTNMQTGEEEVPPIEFWEEVVSKLDLTDQQVRYAEDLRWESGKDARHGLGEGEGVRTLFDNIWVGIG